MNIRTWFFTVAVLALHTSVFAGNGDYVVYNKTFSMSKSKIYEVFIDVDAGEVTVSRSATSQTVSVFMEYDRDQFDERVSFNDDKSRLKVQLDHRGSFVKDDETHAIVEISLPFDVEVMVDSRIKAGEITMYLGGIPIREFSMRNWAGETTVTFDQPNPVTMDVLDVNVKVGEMTIENLGNAHAKLMDINSGIGELTVDFNGDVIDGSKARLDLDIGEASVYMPDNAGVKISIGGFLKFMSAKNIDSDFYKRGSYYYSEDYESQKKKLYVRITPGLGELNISR